MKAVLMSIQPKWCELIASGKKTVEVRKTKPKIETPFKCYIYETQGRTETPFVDEEGHYIFKGRGKVIGEFMCDDITDIRYHEEADCYCVGKPQSTCLNYEELHKYLQGKQGYGWHISDLVIYDDPRELSEFHKIGYHDTKDNVYGWTTEEEMSWQIKRPPQSWMYVEEG